MKTRNTMATVLSGAALALLMTFGMFSTQEAVAFQSGTCCCYDRGDTCDVNGTKVKNNDECTDCGGITEL